LLVRASYQHYDPAIMAIRFTCPSCHQPLEVDDAWAGQAVGCPYCRRVATAPQASTWSGAEVRLASPVQSTAANAFAPPPPPGAYPSPAGAPPHVQAAPRAGGTAVGAFVLTLVGTLIATAGYIALMGSYMLTVQAKLGANATPQQIEDAMREMMASGELQPVAPAAVAFFAVGSGFGIVGLILAIRSLLRQEGRRGLAIASCILGACITLCQILPMLGALAARSTFPSQ